MLGSAKAVSFRAPSFGVILYLLVSRLKNKQLTSATYGILLVPVMYNVCDTSS